MATKTTNYNLTKPDLTDWADIRVLNANMDTIDSEMKAISDRVGTGGTSSGGNISGKLTINGSEVATKSTVKTGTTKGNEVSTWKTYLPDGRVMMKLTVGGQSVVTLPKAMANTQYTVLHCDEKVQLNDVGNVNGDYTAYVCNRGISEKTTTSFKVWSVRHIANTTYKSNKWNETYTGSCECIVIGWEA